jgi:alpha-tubulin suppressor-like RCC1 family protein
MPEWSVLRRRVACGALVSLAVGLGMAGPAPWLALAASRSALPVSGGVSSVSAGGDSACAIEGGMAYCWGWNQNGQLGDGTTADSAVPVAVDASGVLAGKTLTQISTGAGAACALDSDGAAYCWGANGAGQLGDGTTADSAVPVAVDASGVLAGKTLTQISTSGGVTCAIATTGAAYCWGSNTYYGELGDGSTSVSSSVPVAVDTSGALANKTLVQISVGEFAACALDAGGRAYCWGGNSFGELGDGSVSDSSSVPVAVGTGGVLAGKRLTQITATGQYHVCALDTAGAVYCWGSDGFGQLGDGSGGSGINSSVPVAVDTGGVLAGKTITRITGGAPYTCALDSAGTSYCWGWNIYGPLGDGTTTSSSVPVAVDASGVLAGKALTQITAGWYHTCALDTAGAAYCWGDGQYGDLGNDATAESNVPVLAGPAAPAEVTTTAGDTTATVSWTAPGSLDGSTLTGYTATAAPGGAACSTSGPTTCTITGLVNGTSYHITVIAHTTAGDSGASAPATVTPGTMLAFTSDAADTVAFGGAFSFRVTTTGSPPAVISKKGTLPSGVSFKYLGGGTASISGTPAHSASGAYPVTLTARNKTATATQAFTLTVTRAPGLRKIPEAAAEVGVTLSLAITATGYPAPALTESGSLPAGLSFTSNPDGTAAIAGIPLPGSGGSYPITVTAANASGTASQSRILTVGQPPAITSADTASAVTGSAFSFQFTATGFPAAKITETGKLAKGITFTSATAAFSGTPKAGTSGSYPVTITARNSSETVTQNFTLNVS